MRVGIPVWEDRVSPVLDAAERLVVVELGEPWEREDRVVELGQASTARRATAIAGLGLDALICGAVTRRLADMLEGAGVVVIPWISGSIEDVVSAFRDGALSGSRFAMPGCRCGRGGRRQRGRRGRSQMARTRR